MAADQTNRAGLPVPMLSRPGPLPEHGNWSFEVEWDGFRALVRTHGGLHVSSRRGWNMTSLLPELEELPSGLVLDGEIVAFNEEGLPWFPSVCDRLVHGDAEIRVSYIVFDLLQQNDESLLHLPYRQRRDRLEALTLEGPAWRLSPRFDDGLALYHSICALGMEGVVAKPSGGAYRPGYYGWIRVKNTSYWRYEEEHERPALAARPTTNQRRSRFER